MRLFPFCVTGKHLEQLVSAMLQHEVKRVFKYREVHNIKKALSKKCFFLARPKGFEPSTCRFVAGHSIH